MVHKSIWPHSKCDSSVCLTPEVYMVDIFLARLLVVELLSSLRRQRLGRLSFRLSFLSESISQKLSEVSHLKLGYLFTIKRGTNYNKADDPVICISRVICPCFDIVHRNQGYFFSIIKISQ